MSKRHVPRGQEPLRDTTERQRAEEALQQNEPLYRRLGRNLSHGAIILFDHDLRYRVVEGVNLPDMVFSRKNLEGKTLWEVLPPETSSTLEPCYRAALAGQPTSYQIEFRGQLYHIHILPLLSEIHEIYGGLIIIVEGDLILGNSFYQSGQETEIKAGLDEMALISRMLRQERPMWMAATASRYDGDEDAMF